MVHNRGKSLGFPTANIETDKELIPADGVYAVKVKIADCLYDAACNIGVNPTFASGSRSIEVFIFDFAGELYGQDIRVYFFERLRGEERFASPPQLAAAIARDVARCREDPCSNPAGRLPRVSGGGMKSAGRVDLKFLLGIGISLFFLVLLFRKIDFDQLAAAFKILDYRYLAAAVLITLFSYCCRAVRWHFLVLPLKRARPRNLLAATIICYMGNNLLPARLGEFLRAIVLAEKEQLEVSAVFATLVVDRLFDGFSVLLILVVTFFTVQLPPGMEKVQQGLVTGGYVTLALYVAVIAFLVVLKRATARTIHILSLLLRPFPQIVSDKIIPILGSFISGIRLPAKPGELTALLVSSLLIWATAAWPIDLVFKAFQYSASLYGSPVHSGLSGLCGHGSCVTWVCRHLPCRLHVRAHGICNTERAGAECCPGCACGRFFSGYSLWILLSLERENIVCRSDVY